MEKQKARWFYTLGCWSRPIQFSVRQLLLATLVVAVLLTCVLAFMSGTRLGTKRRLKQLGADVVIIDDNGVVVVLSFKRCKVSVEAFSEHSSLKHLDLSFTQLEREHLDSLTSFTVLSDLNLCATNVLDEDLRPISKLHNLRNLDLSGTAITNQTLEVIKKLPNLKSLDVSLTHVSSAGVANLISRRPDMHVRYSN